MIFGCGGRALGKCEVIFSDAYLLKERKNERGQDYWRSREPRAIIN